MENVSRRSFVAGAAAVAAAGLAIAESAPVAVAAEAAEHKPNHAGEPYNYTFNNGPLTAAEFHAQLDEYNWETDQLTIMPLVEAAKGVSDDEARAILFNEPQITTDFVKSDGTVIPAIYVQLRNRLNRIGIGLGAEINEKNFDFLVYEFTPEEAELYCKVPLFRYFNDEEAAEAAGISVAKAKELCDAMSYRGVMNRVTRCGVSFYHCLTLAHGILEFTLDRYCAGAEGGREYLAKLFTLQGADFGYTTRNLGSAFYLPIPVSKDIVTDPTILPYCDYEQIVERNDVIAVMPCQCRTFTPILAGGEPGDWCDHPVETCLSFGEQAQYYIENGLGRQIDKAEARQIIQGAVDSGLVVQIMNTKQTDVICQCHGDCCSMLRNYIALDGDIENFKYVSNYNLVVDTDTCIKCGACAQRCPMFTITMDEETGYPVVGNVCVRCGQCAYVCPTESRKLTARPEEERFELNCDMLDDYYQKSLERAKRGMIVDFDPALVQG